ncbi:MAG TPA: metalloregulator ArsR/SmtB family transcription factor [Stellaceae bacterium]|nr:metalloregulator ArsR/SmtB family transcription factor [Stellaceae bacterium]
MSETLDIARVGALMGDPSRASMLMALMSGEALTATELAYRAGIALPTASGHLAQLVDGGLLAVAKQGRHRYYRLAGPAVAHAVETMSELAIEVFPSPRRRVMPEDAPLRRARTCYDHLAGRLGVALAEGLVQRRVLRRADGELALVRRGSGEELLNAWGIDVAELESERRPMVRTCIDWTERRPHLAGALGAAIVDRFLETGWIRRRRDDRAVSVTPLGQRRLREELGVSV